MSKQDYWEYLKSDVWKQKRGAALVAAHSRCRLCDSSDYPNVHHKVYPNIFGNELISDLVVLCRECHKFFHGIKDKPARAVVNASKTVQEFLDNGGKITMLPLRRSRTRRPFNDILTAVGLPYCYR